jgi:hypothetical protein
MKKLFIAFFFLSVVFGNSLFAEKIKPVVSFGFSSDALFFEPKNGFTRGDLSIASDCVLMDDNGRILNMIPRLTAGLEWQGFMIEGGYLYGNNYSFTQELEILPSYNFELVKKNFTVSYDSFELSFYKVFKWQDQNDPPWKTMIGLGVESFNIKKYYTINPFASEDPAIEPSIDMPNLNFSITRAKIIFKQSIRIHGKGTGGGGLFLDMEFAMRLKSKVLNLEDIDIGLSNNYFLMGFRVILKN